MVRGFRLNQAGRQRNLAGLPGHIESFLSQEPSHEPHHAQAPPPPLQPRRALRHFLCCGLLLANSAGAAAADTHSSPLDICGAIRFNYVYKSWQREHPHGFVGLDTLRLDVKYDDGRRIGSAQYRYNSFPSGQGGYTNHFLHHGWAGLRFDDKSELHVGVDKLPFGLLPYASNNFFESIAQFFFTPCDYK